MNIDRLLSRIDWRLVSVCLLATLFGQFATFDAGFVRSLGPDGSLSLSEPLTSLLGALLAIGISAIVVMMSPKKLQQWAWPVGIVSAILCFALLIPGVGKTMDGATRWIRLIGNFTIQPSEFAKFASIMLLSSALASFVRPPEKKSQDFAVRLDRYLHYRWTAILAFAFVGLIAFKIEREPDLGTASVIGSVMFAMIVLTGVRWRTIGLLMGAVALLIGFMIVREPYRAKRFEDFASAPKTSTISKTGYQTAQAKTSLANGGWFGVGPGSGRAKHVLGKTASSDFLFVTIGEEFGLVGALIVIMVLGMIVLRLYDMSRQAPTKFGRLVLLGTAVWIGVQSCVNVMMANGSIPAIGIPLPFLSAGGSSLLSIWMAIGLCQAVAAGEPELQASYENHRHRWRDRRPRISRA